MTSELLSVTDSIALPAMFAGARYLNPDGHEILLHTQEFEGIQDHGELWWGNRIRDGRCEPLLVTPRGLIYHGYTPSLKT